jgi:hypothetical protein
MGPTAARIASLMALAAAGVGSGALVACGTSAPAPQSNAIQVENAIQASCTATMPPSCPASTPHYADVEPILEKSCVPCHPGPAGSPQWPLTVYGDIAPWAGVIQDEVCGNTMPPVDGGIGIDQSDRLTILDWVQCGAPE